MKNLIIFIGFFLLASCQTLQIRSVQEKANNTETFQKTVENSCAYVKNGSFLANVSSSHAPSVFWEGVWNNGVLKTQTIDSSGHLIEPNPFLDMQKKLGPQGLRRVMCGLTGFSHTISIDGRKIKVKSTFKESILAGKRIIETTSTFYYGLFALKKDKKNTLIWKGQAENNQIKPLLIYFGTTNDSLTLNILEFY